LVAGKRQENKRRISPGSKRDSALRKTMKGMVFDHKLRWYRVQLTSLEARAFFFCKGGKGWITKKL